MAVLCAVVKLDDAQLKNFHMTLLLCFVDVLEHLPNSTLRNVERKCVQ